jgi:YVTN family beta-propeller protein
MFRLFRADPSPVILIYIVSSLTLCPPLHADERNDLPVGLQPDGRVVVPTNQILRPAGQQVTFPGRPVDLAFADDGKTLVIKNMKNLLFLDLATAKVMQTLDLPDDPPIAFNPIATMKKAIAPDGKGHHYLTGFSVVGLLVHGKRVYVTDSQNQVRLALRQEDGRYRWGAGVEVASPKVGGLAYPAGMALLSNSRMWVASSRGNSVQLLNLMTGKVEQTVAVGVAPYMVVCPTADRAYVSNWGGDAPRPGNPQELSSGTPVRIDPKSGVANQGTISILTPLSGQWKQHKTVRVGLHPCGMIADPSARFLYVANANSDTISVLDMETNEVVETIPCRPEARLPFGSGCNALALSRDGGTLYVANGTNNCIAVIRLGRRACKLAEPGRAATSQLIGLIATAWYPGAVLVSPNGKHLCVANVKGVGSLSQPRPVAEGKNTHDFLGSVSLIDVPDEPQLAKYTQEVNANNRQSYSLTGLARARPDAKPVPVPLRHGEPSVFRHVIYVIKENRSYDQILGDMREGNGDPRLVLFGETVTPNQHALARQFTLFDNFYCSGALSATGHQWVSEAYVTDYLEKAFGGFTRSYPVDGDDALAFASSGFLWANALDRGKTFRNYGEFIKSSFPKGATWTDAYRDYTNHTRRVQIDVKANVALMRPHTHPHYPGFPLLSPDVYRASLFIEELKAFEKRGELPNLMYVFLPCNHSVGTTPGFPTPRAMVADNDLALGQIVEAVSRSKFWPETCILVVEDDPQFGFDHVDAHRTTAQVISPYTRRRFVDHTNYNQTGMVKSIELILGLPPMNQFDLSATPLRNCFQAQPDLTPFSAVPNQIPLDEMNPPLSALSGKALHWARRSLELSFVHEDEADEDTLNRIIWHATRGYGTPYPERHARKDPD